MAKTKAMVGGSVLFTTLLISVGVLLLIRDIINRPDTDNEDAIEQPENLTEIKEESLELPTNNTILERLQKMQLDVNAGLRLKKTPAEVLHELLRADGGKAAKYKYTKLGEGDERFECTVRFGNNSSKLSLSHRNSSSENSSYEVTATGPNKKASMQIASMRMTGLLAGVDVPDDFYHIPAKMRREYHSSSSTNSTPPVAEAYQEFLEVHNFIGALKLLADERLSEEPQYALHKVTGPPHNKVFTMVCTFKGISAFGDGTSKKAAKQKAAESMWTTYFAITNGTNFESATLWARNVVTKKTFVVLTPKIVQFQEAFAKFE